MAADAPVQIPRQRISELIEREEKQLNERTQRSKETYERAQLLLVEDLVDEALVAHRHDVAVLRRGDARRLLATVLERVEREVREARDLATGCDDAEDSALIARAITVVEKRFGGGVHGDRRGLAVRNYRPGQASKRRGGCSSLARRNGVLSATGQKLSVRVARTAPMRSTLP